MEEFAKIRSNLRIRKPINFLPIVETNLIAEENADDSEGNDENLADGDQIFRNNLNLLLKHDPRAIEYVAKDYFQFESIDSLSEALQSVENFQQFLVSAILSQIENPDLIAYNSLVIVNILINNEIDVQVFLEPNFLFFLLTALDNDFENLALLALDVMNLLIKKTSDVYVFLKSNGLIEKLFSSCSNFEDKSNEAVQMKYLDEVSYTLDIVLTNEIFDKDDLPKLWELAQLLLQLDGSSITTERAVGALALICKNGYCGAFHEDVMMDMQYGYFNDSIGIFKNFIQFLKYCPMRNDFFQRLLNAITLDNMMLEIQIDDKDNPQYIYVLLGEMFFTSDSKEFMELTIEKLTNGQFNTQIGILFYFSKILSNSPTRDLIQLLIDGNALNTVVSLLSSEEASATSTSLMFLGTLLNCYTKLFSKKPSEFPHLDIVVDSLYELIDNFTDETIRLQATNIIELIHS